MEKRIPGKKHFMIFFVIVILLLGAAGIGIINFGEKEICSDGTEYDLCSANPPYYCFEGKLIEYAPLCKCPFNWTVSGRVCKSDLMVEEKNISFNYNLRGEEKSFDFVLFGGVYNYLEDLDKSVESVPGEIISRRDFKLKAIDEEVQRNFLIPLVIKIQNSYEEPFDQVLAAVSVIQNFPYVFSEKKVDFHGTEANYSRYPYEVLYENAGICSERVDLLAFILREMGYGVIVFYFPERDHEAIGIRCPRSVSFDDTGYCFIETTGSFPYDAIWNSDPATYGVSRNYQMVLISEGKILRRID